MARLDRVKNLTGLAQWFGQNRRLRQLCNLVIVGGIVDPEQSNDREEKDECRKMHDLIEQHNMQGDFRCGLEHCSHAMVISSVGWLYR